jgi:hypothetical protein
MVTQRECGDCQVCCIVPEINECDLFKPSGNPCPHLCPAGCSIQESKPAACQRFLCAWRVMPEIDEGWRPDRIGLLGIVGVTEAGKRAVQFIPFRSAKVLAASAVVKELRRLVSTLEVWIGLPLRGEWPPSRKLHLNGLPNRVAWRRLGNLAGAL